MDERIPGPVRPVLERYRQLLEERLPGLVEGLYLHGSIALAAYNARSSDVDFVAVVTRRPGKQEVEQLRQVHGIVRQEYPRPKLAGIYFPREELGRPREEVAPYPCYEGSALNPVGFFELNPVTWWTLAKCGVTVWGPPAQTLPLPADDGGLLRWMIGNLNSFWAGYTRRPARIAALWSNWGIEWTVLGVLRQYYTFRERDITSKTGAGHYALSCLPARWHRLIREALRIREGAGGPLYRSRTGRAWEAYRFLQYIIAVCNQEGKPWNEPNG